MKKVVKLEASETIFYEFFIEVDVPDDEEWSEEDLKNEAECNLYETDLSYTEFIVDSDSFTLEECFDYGNFENLPEHIKVRVIRLEK